MIIPQSVERGDTIAMIAPAGMVNKTKVEGGIKILREKGFEVKTGSALYNVYNRFAGADEERLENLTTALKDPEVKAILTARGGYGTVRLLDKLDPQAFRDNPKWIAGYSDITYLHAWLQHHVGMASIHGSLGVNYETNTDRALDSLFRSMSGHPVDVTSEPSSLQRDGSVTARLVGGNLSIIQAMQGMPEQFDFDGKILLIEEIAEYPYHVDRMMWNLKRSGALSNLAGLVIGGFSSMQVNNPPFGQSSEEIIRGLVEEYDYPVAVDMPIGHIDDNHAVIIGGKYQLDVNSKKSLLTYVG